MAIYVRVVTRLCHEQTYLTIHDFTGYQNIFLYISNVIY